MYLYFYVNFCPVLFLLSFKMQLRSGRNLSSNNVRNEPYVGYNVNFKTFMSNKHYEKIKNLLFNNDQRIGEKLTKLDKMLDYLLENKYDILHASFVLPEWDRFVNVVVKKLTEFAPAIVKSLVYDTEWINVESYKKLQSKLANVLYIYKNEHSEITEN